VHKSVLVKEVLDFLNLSKAKIILDATVGCGGHSEEILKNIIPNGKLIGIDADNNALEIANNKLQHFKDSFELVNDNFRNLDNVLDRLGVKKIDGALFDLGVSSLQLDSTERGFSLSIPQG